MALSIDDFRLCEQVAQDLSHIRDAWSGELSEHVIRRESPMIRRLLADGDYSTAWRKLGLPRQPLVMANDLEDSLGAIPKHVIRYAFPSPNERTRPVGGNEQSVTMLNPGVSEGDLMIAAPAYSQGQGALFLVVPKAETTLRKPDEIVGELVGQFGNSYLRPMWLTDFLDSAGAYVDAQRITRREIIDFVTNAMGGAHYDPDSKRLNKAARNLLKPLHVKWRGNTDVHAPWIELMSIGQTVAWSADAKRFLAEFDKVVPPDDMPLG